MWVCCCTWGVTRELLQRPSNRFLGRRVDIFQQQIYTLNHCGAESMASCSAHRMLHSCYRLIQVWYKIPRGCLGTLQSLVGATMQGIWTQQRNRHEATERCVGPEVDFWCKRFEDMPLFNSYRLKFGFSTSYAGWREESLSPTSFRTCRSTFFPLHHALVFFDLEVPHNWGSSNCWSIQDRQVETAPNVQQFVSIEAGSMT